MVYGIVLPTLLIISWFFALQLLRIWPTRFQIHRCKGSWQWTMSILMRLRNIAGWWLTYPSEKYESQVGSLFPIYGKIKNDPNHKPVSHWWIHIYIYVCFLLLVITVNSQVIDEYEHVNIIPIWMRRFWIFHVLSTVFQDFRMTILFYSIDYHLIRKLFVAPWLLIWYGKWIPI